MTPYNPTDWYWNVGGSATQVFSSAAGNYVPIANPAYTAWLADGNAPSRIASEAELGEVLAQHRIRPVAANVLDSFKNSHADLLTKEVVAKILLFLVNEVRVLKGQQPVTAAQFKSFVKDQM